MTIPRLAVLYEHPEWFQPLFDELERRGIEYEKWAAQRLLYDPGDRHLPSLVVNRMSPSAGRRRHANALFASLQFVSSLESRGVRVVNGSHPFSIEISKARQIDLFRDCGVAYPRTRIINHPSLVLDAVKGLEFPVCVKPNVGGSGAGVRRFDTLAELQHGIPEVDFGVDSAALVQEFIPARGGCICRIETLNGEFLYALRILPDFQDFNLCPGTRQFPMEACQPPQEAVDAALRLAQAACLDIGGIEYLIDDRNGRICFYDINALSNFVAQAPETIGFDPTARFVDYLVGLTSSKTLR